MMVVATSSGHFGSCDVRSEVNENKISTKNAFELPLIEHMDDIVDSFMGGRKAKTKSALP